MKGGRGMDPSLKGAAKERNRKREAAADEAMHRSGDGLPPHQYERTPAAGALPTMHQAADSLHPTGRMDGKLRYKPTPPAGKVP